MSLTSRLTMARSRSRLPRRTVRLRLTALYGALFLLAGAALLAVTYLLVRSTGHIVIITDPKTNPSGVGKKLFTGTQGQLHGLHSTPLTPAEVQQVHQLTAQANATHASDVNHLLVTSGIALAIMAVLAVALGWLIAGRVLRPLRSMTTATHQISEHNLHQRLALQGPSDEIQDLADTIDGLLGRLETAFDAQRRFVANASHEMRTPLTLNRALLEVNLANPNATADELRTMGQELIASGESQERLIEALLTLATSERGLDRWEQFDLSAVASDVLLGPHPEIDQLGLDVQTSLLPAPIAGDPRLAERLVANLFDNAILHNVAGGYIHIATRTETGQSILSITNSGEIIPQDDTDRLFQPFQRRDGDRRNHPDGHGLGLSIVHAIVAAHGATLTTHTQPSGGLHIEMRFPPRPAASNAKIRARDTAEKSQADTS